MGGGKNAFEIRLELLQLAYKIVKDAADVKTEIVNNGTDIIVKPTMSPSADEIIKLASKLNGFVSHGTSGNN